MSTHDLPYPPDFQIDYHTDLCQHRREAGPQIPRGGRRLEGIDNLEAIPVGYFAGIL
jgi:hypothetical protein